MPADHAPVPPQPSRGYGAVAFFTFLAMAFSITLLVWEYSDYGFKTAPDSTPPIKVDKTNDRGPAGP